MFYSSDMIKNRHWPQPSIAYLLYMCVRSKEGLAGMFLEPVHCVVFCYNPRLYALFPRCMPIYSRLDGNSTHRTFEDAISLGGYGHEVKDGLFQDQGLRSRVHLDDERRHMTNDGRVNTFSRTHVLEQDSHGRLYYTDRSMAVVCSYSRHAALALLREFLRESLRYFRGRTRGSVIVSRRGRDCSAGRIL